MEMQYEGWFYTSLVTTLVVIFFSFLFLYNIALLKKKKKTGTGTSSSGAAVTVKPQNNTQTAGSDYEVFLSFRGADTRTSFTDYLYNDLVDAGIRTFRDDDELRVGEKIGPELLNAIRQSKISIPIFSTNYASSKWCLMELAQMVDCMRSTTTTTTPAGQGQMILPIFYDVEPSDVRNQTGRSFGQAFRDHEKRFDGETVRKWKEALRVVAELKGWDVKKFADGHQGKLIKDVVSKVLKELKKKYLFLTDCLVELDYLEDEMMRLLSVDSNNVTIVGIHGMGGIGKTTISKVVYNKLVEHFECCSFLADVREKSQQQKGLVNLQNKLLSDILKGKEFNVTNTNEGINMIKDRFCSKKVLIVLDDVDKRFHLDALAGKRDWFGSGSRIIITTRNKDLLNVPQVDWTYEAKEMDSNQALQLFSKHAFRSEHPPVDFDVLSRDVVSTVSGLPLALEIIGSFLSGKEKTVWKDTVKKLKIIPNDQVLKKLRISYEALDYQQKHIFLDIACLVIKMDKRIASHMWDDCELYPEHGIEVLVLMSLVKIGDNNELRMHDQLRGLGREIVREENFKEPGKRSRVWNHQDALDILESHEGSREVETLCLDFKFNSGDYCFKNEEFANMSNLRFLELDIANIDGDFNHLFLKLRWLRWKGCPQNFKQTNFYLKNLVILDLSWSKVTETWDGWSLIKMAKKLKVLNLTRCHYLNSTPDFSSYSTLERLFIDYCKSLVQIDPSIGHLKSLVFLNMMNCAKLKELPLEFGSLESLVELLIDGTSIQEFQEIRKLSKLETLTLYKINISTLQLEIGALSQLKELVIQHCVQLQCLPILPSGLVKLSLEVCESLERLSDLSVLKNLCELSLSHCSELTEILGLGELELLTSLDVSECEKLTNLDGLQQLVFLRYLRTSGCKSLEALPDLSKLKKLRKLVTLRCEKISDIPGIDGLESLEHLNMSWCTSMERSPNLSNLEMLKELVLIGCMSLREIEGLEDLKSIKRLDLSLCTSLERLPNLSNLKILKELLLLNCEKLTGIHGLEELQSLAFLDISGCKLVEGMPDLSSIKKVQVSRANLRDLSTGFRV